MLLFYPRNENLWDGRGSMGDISGLVSTLVVNLEEADSSSIIPLDSVAGSASWDAGSADAKMSRPSNGNAHSGSHQSTELRVGEAPLLSQPFGYLAHEGVGLFAQHSIG